MAHAPNVRNVNLDKPDKAAERVRRYEAALRIIAGQGPPPLAGTTTATWGDVLHAPADFYKPHAVARAALEGRG